MRHCVKSWAAAAVAILALAAIATPSAEAAVELHITGPQYGTSPVYVNTFTEFSLSGGTDMWYRWEGYAWMSYTGSFHAEGVMESSPDGPPGLPVPLEGPQTLHFNASGEMPQQRDFYVDDLPPSTAIGFTGNHHAGEHVFIVSDTLVTLSATDAGSGVAETRYSVGDGPETVYSAPFTLPGPTPVTITYFSVDNLGNREPGKPQIIYMDNDPPEVAVIAGNPQTASSGRTYVGASTPISLSFTDLSGIASSSYRLNEGAWTAYTGPFTLPSEGRHTVHARATDNLGHASAAVSAEFWMDATPPTVSVTGAEQGSVLIAQGGELQIVCHDADAVGCTIYYSFTGGAPWSTYTQPITVTEPANLTFYAEDAVGNAAVEATVQVLVDRTAEPSEGWTVEWRLLLGVGLITGGILVLAKVFMTGRGKRGASKKAGPDDRPADRSRRKRNF